MKKLKGSLAAKTVAVFLLAIMCIAFVGSLVGVAMLAILNSLRALRQ